MMQMLLRFSSRRVLAAFLLLVFAAFSPAAAQSLDELRRQGAIGERYDGFAIVRQPSAAVQALVSQVNAQRSRIYAERAKQQNAPADQVGRVYARQIFQQAPQGTYFLDESGRWVRK